MDTKNQQNNFNNPVVIVLILALVGLGGYVLFSKNSSDNIENKTTDSVNIPKTQETQTVQTQPVNTVKPKTESNQLTVKQKECTDMFDAFKLKVLNQTSTDQAGMKNYFSISASDFVIGYSPRLDNCVGGYTYKLLSSGSGTVSISYFIVDPKTNLILKNWPEYNSIMMTYENYRKTLDQITNGQISVNNINPKEDQTPGLMFCNVSYYKCPIGDKPMCNPNNPSSTGWCASQ